MHVHMFICVLEIKWLVAKNNTSGPHFVPVYNIYWAVVTKLKKQWLMPHFHCTVPINSPWLYSSFQLGTFGVWYQKEGLNNCSPLTSQREPLWLSKYLICNTLHTVHISICIIFVTVCLQSHHIQPLFKENVSPCRDSHIQSICNGKGKMWYKSE